MNCDECQQLMRPQTVAEVIPSLADDPRASDPMELATLVGYESPEGHEHDDNCLSRVYVCSNQHQKKVSLRRSCPTCDWLGRETCFCHTDPKVKERPV